jgi:pimeloyl-ACP methyl ester carboxylesterase
MQPDGQHTTPDASPSDRNPCHTSDARTSLLDRGAGLSIAGHGGDPSTAARLTVFDARSEYIEVDAIRTHYLTAGDGPPLVLLHSGEFGACAELSWELVIPRLAEHYRVVAPDWLGFGETDKIFDFGGGTARRLRHMAAFLAHLGIERAPFVGSSMAGTVLARVLAGPDPVLPVSAAVLVSGGGFVPLNESRQALLDFDGSEQAMRSMIRVLLHDPAWALSNDYIARRLAIANRPGAWEAVAAARFKSPQVPARLEFGQPDTTDYEAIGVPVLVLAGAQDKLREPGYAEAIATRIPSARARVYENCGHVPNLEVPEAVAHDVLTFLREVDPGSHQRRGAPVAGATGS